MTGPAYGAQRLVEVSDYAADVLAAFEAEGIEVHQLHPEYAPAQFEISVGALGPVAAADRSVLARQTIQAVSRRHGVRASFSPAYLPTGVGNGGHVHVSLWKDGVNLHSGGDRRHGLTPTAEAFAGGVLAHLPALTAIGAPSPASYLRLKPSRWAGAYTAWGVETRETALRVVRGTVGERAGAANLEVKPVDLAANPYLLLGALIGTGLDGVATGATLPEEVTGDPSRFSAEEARSLGVHRLPTSLADAVQALEADQTVQGVLGDYLTEAVMVVRSGEVDAMAGKDDEQVAAAYRWTY